MFTISVPIVPLLIYYDVQVWIQNVLLKNVNENEMNGIMRS